MAEVKGTYISEIYKNDMNGYIVGLMRIKEASLSEYNNKVITFTGTFHELKIKTNYVFQGEFVSHPKYGNQFVVSSYEILIPTDTEELVNFFSSDLFPIGEKTAEKLKIEIGCAYPRDEELTLDVQGRNIITGLPSTVTVSSTEMLEALEEPITQIFEAVHNVLERTPPELMADISQRGIVMTGGGAMLYGLDHMLSNRIGIDVYLAQDPISCVVIGTGKALDMMDKFAALSDN